jgi:hypothetical protein
MQLDTTPFRRRALDARDEEITDLTQSIMRALEGDSNDAEHDALVSVAQFFGIDYDPEAAYT